MTIKEKASAVLEQFALAESQDNDDGAQCAAHTSKTYECAHNHPNNMQYVKKHSSMR